jgi:hypothetical protein
MVASYRSHPSQQDNRKSSYPRSLRDHAEVADDGSLVKR